MDCVIKIIKGPGEGTLFQCSGAETVIGRSPRSHVKLPGGAISYEHAVITRNGDEFFVENLSASGTYLNDERITGKVRLRTKDQLRVGSDTIVRVEAMPASGKGDSRKRLLMWAVIVMIVLAAALILFDPFSADQSSGDWRGAYAKLDAWTEGQVAAGNLPREAQKILREGWRLDRAGNRPESSQQWLRLAVLLDHEEGKLGLKEAAANRRHALDSLLTPASRKDKDPMTDEEMGAALVQFVTAMERKK